MHFTGDFKEPAPHTGDADAGWRAGVMGTTVSPQGAGLCADGGANGSAADCGRDCASDSANGSASVGAQRPNTTESIDWRREVDRGGVLVVDIRTAGQLRAPRALGEVAASGERRAWTPTPHPSFLAETTFSDTASRPSTAARSTAYGPSPSEGQRAARGPAREGPPRSAARAPLRSRAPRAWPSPTRTSRAGAQARANCGEAAVL